MFALQRTSIAELVNYIGEWRDSARDLKTLFSLLIMVIFRALLINMYTFFTGFSTFYILCQCYLTFKFHGPGSAAGQRGWKNGRWEWVSECLRVREGGKEGGRDGGIGHNPSQTCVLLCKLNIFLHMQTPKSWLTHRRHDNPLLY